MQGADACVTVAVGAGCPPRLAVMSTCSVCGSDEIDDAGSRRECMACGAIVAESVVVSEVTFDDSGGSAGVVGTHVWDQGGSLSHSARAPARTGFGKESRELILEKGKRRIRVLAGSLSLSGTRIVESADRLFRLCVQNNFIQGRKTDIVLAVCLYVVCRQQQTSHMLIDFSDILSINMFIMGNTFLKMIQLLNLNIPPVDPSFFVHRFANQLEFGDQAHAVAMTALKIVARMKRDWMTTGRRPSGICGAALLVAGRFHGFKRSQQEITDVVHICDETLRKRLNELALTPAANMTLEELDRLTEEEIEASSSNMIPPAMQQNILKEEEFVAKAAKGMDDSLAAAEAQEDVKEVEEYLKLCASNPEAAAVALVPNKALLEEPDEDSAAKPPSAPPRKKQKTEPGKKSKKQTAAVTLTAEVKNKVAARRKKEMAKRELQKQEEERLWEAELKHEGFDDLDEEELDKYQLDDDAAAFKEKMWVAINADWIKKQEKRSKLEAEQLAKGITPTKKRKPHKKKALGADNAADATMNVLTEKKVSKVINYEVLQSLLAIENPEETKDTAGGAEEREDDPLGLLEKQAAEEEEERRKEKEAGGDAGDEPQELDYDSDIGQDEEGYESGDDSDTGGDEHTMALQRQMLGAPEDDFDDFD